MSVNNVLAIESAWDVLESDEGDQVRTQCIVQTAFTEEILDRTRGDLTCSEYAACSIARSPQS